MAIRPLFVSTTPIKQTDDTSEDRSNNYPSIIKDNDGRYIMFYEKRLKTGRTSVGGITFTSPSFDCSVPAGTGVINEIVVSWTSVILTLPSDSYVLIYVTSSGAVGYTDDFPVSFTKDVIILAFAYVGNTSIVRILEVEKDGFYVYYKKQVLSGSAYIWDDYEYKLNVGIKPEAFYDSSTDKIYLSCQKDGASMVREFDLSDSNTWEDLNHILLVDPTIYSVPQPKVDVLVSVAYGNSIIENISPPLFDFATEIYVGLEIESNDPYLFIPRVESSFNDYATFPAIMNVFSKVGSIYTLIDQFNIYSENKYLGFSELWSHTRGNKYAGLEVEHTLFVGAYVTEPFNYALIHIPDNIDETEVVDSTHLSSNIYPEVWNLSVAYSNSIIEKTNELDQIFKFTEDSISDMKVAYGNSIIEKTNELDQIFEFTEDSISDIKVAYGNSIHSIVNV